MLIRLEVNLSPCTVCFVAEPDNAAELIYVHTEPTGWYISVPLTAITPELTTNTPNTAPEPVTAVESYLEKPPILLYPPEALSGSKFWASIKDPSETLPCRTGERLVIKPPSGRTVFVNNLSTTIYIPSRFKFLNLTHVHKL